MSDTIKTWYEFTLAQIASDSYLDEINYKNRSDDLDKRLRFGANHYAHREQNIADNNLSATQMTDVMIDDFFDT